MSEINEQKQILNEIILGYRRVVELRYDFENIRTRAGFPDSFNEERINKFKAYFLNYLYPLPDRREQLNESFAGLDHYLKHPDKLLLVIVDSSSLLFQFGRHLPKILITGIKALRSFKSANSFEEKLVEKAIFLGLEPPFSVDEIDKLIATLSKEEIEEFIEGGQNLFETLHDRTLVSKIKQVIEQLIKKMKQRPHVYSPAEITGLEIGKEIIEEGDALFDELSKEEQARIFTFIIDMEREVLHKIFSGE